MGTADGLTGDGLAGDGLAGDGLSDDGPGSGTAPAGGVDVCSIRLRKESSVMISIFSIIQVSSWRTIENVSRLGSTRTRSLPLRLTD